MFETLIVQPIFNLLLWLYITVGDFGIAIILFTIIVRFAMWPLLRRQLHQSKVMRDLQPKIKEVRKKNKGNKQAESAALMELYKEHGVNPVGSIMLLVVQLPVFFGLFNALNSFISNPERIIHLPYDFLVKNAEVQAIMNTVADKTNTAILSLGDAANQQQIFNQVGGSPVTASALRAMPEDQLTELFNKTLTIDTNSVTQLLVQGPFFDQKLFGIIDLSDKALSNGTVYIPVLIIAILAGVFQYFQTKQLTPKKENSKSFRDIMKESAKTGKEPDQSEISAAIGSRMGLIFAPLIALISATAPAGLALYFATGGLVGLLQQRRVLGQDVDEMEVVADVIEDEDKAIHKKETTKTQPKKKKGAKTTPHKKKPKAKKKR